MDHVQITFLWRVDTGRACVKHAASTENGCHHYDGDAVIASCQVSVSGTASP